MASSTRNVKLGVCQVFFDGVDLGYTKGGVEVTVSTDSYKVNVDQFGKSAISEVITGRNVMAKVPMAETTVENLVRIMPGAVLVSTGGTAASATFTPTGNVTANQTLNVNGTVITAKASGAIAANNEFNLGVSVAATLIALRDFINASTDANLALVTASASATVLTVTADEKGVAGNSFTIATGTWTGTVSGATFSGGADATKKRVDVTNSIGTDLLTIAKELRLHPTNKIASDKSDDFIIPLSATAGALQFAYKLEDERIYNVEFTGYPDPTTKLLFSVGDPTAT